MFDALANLIVYQWFGLSAESHAGAAVHFFVMDTAKIFVMLVIIIYVMGLLRALLSPEKVRDYVRGKPRWLARSSAVTLGAVTPFCSCSSVPLFIGFVEAGIPLGVPLYSNATGVIPVAEAMLGKGVAIGTTLAFMMSIAALSLPEMIILRKVIKWPALALYAGVLAVAFMLVGWGFNLGTF